MILFPSDTAARVRYSMAMASRFFANNLGIKPSVENPIVIASRNEYGNEIEKEEMLFLWTAFVLFTQKISNIDFDIKFIRCETNDPSKSEWAGSWFFGLFKGFVGISLYETEFKNYLTDKMFCVSKFAPLYFGVSGELSLKHQMRLHIKPESIIPNFSFGRYKEIITKVNINYHGENGDTALIVAVKTNNKKNVELLLEHLANPYLINDNGEKASDLVTDSSSLILTMLKGHELLYATKYGEFDLVERLVKTGININFQDSSGCSSLHIAVKEKLINIIRLFLLYGADPLLQNQECKSSFDLAPNKKIVGILRYHQKIKIDETQNIISLAQLHQRSILDQEPNNDLSFYFYMKAAELGCIEALASLERLCEEASSQKQVELGMLYQTVFCDYTKATYWHNKASESEGDEIKESRKFRL